MSESPPDCSAVGRDIKEVRLQRPSGFLYLTQHESAPILLDALLDLLPGRKFNKSELADYADVTRQIGSNYIDLLLEANIVEEVPNTSPRRYQVAESDVVQELFELNSVINAADDWRGATDE